ncbi:MAG TPA: type II secretion system protein GspM [Anaerolineales bacterium]|nr:type II secretion system protein GspM [Anaerolineales bacterium]
MAEDDNELKKAGPDAGNGEKSDSWREVIRRWLRRIIIVLLIFIMLVAVAWFGLIGPRAAEVANLQTELAAAQQQIDTLEAQVAELQSIRAQRSILSLLVDANSARFELARGDTEAASAALQNTSNTLYQLNLELGSEYDETIEGLETRLSLARESIQAENDLSSLNDLEVFIGTLQDLLKGLLSK